MQPSIKVFDEEVDFDLHPNETSVSRMSSPRSGTPEPSSGADLSLPASMTLHTQTDDAPASLRPPQATELPVSNTGSNAIEESGTRFYITKKVIVGNTSKFILPDQRKNAVEPFTHKWRIHVRGPPDDPAVESFIRKVRFFLHPSYKPNDLIEVLEPPFTITRFGWGEFPARVQLHFVDPRNKPFDIYHILKLTSTSTDWVLGAERTIDVEVDRRTFLSTPVVPSTDAGPQAIPVGSSSVHTTDLSQLDPRVEDWLNQLVESFPLVRPQAAAPLNGDTSLPFGYPVAFSVKEFFAWNLGRRKSVEWRRARKMRLFLADRVGIHLSTKTVLLWCRDRGLTPAQLVSRVSRSVEGVWMLPTSASFFLC